jgi:hypothetical protein
VEALRKVLSDRYGSDGANENAGIEEAAPKERPA